MKLLLTDRFCDRAKSHKAQIDYFDETVPGLALRVSVKRKSWTLHYVQDGRQRRLTFGQYPAISLAAARRMAIEAKGDVAEGVDPAVEADTLKAISEEYLRRSGSKLRSVEWQERVLNRLVYPVMGDKPITDIRRTDIIRLLDQIEDENGAVMADRTMALIRRVMNWHAARSDEFRSPIVRGMARAQAKARDRILTDDEVRAVWAVNGDGSVFASFIRFLLLTGARRTEASHMQWAEIKGADWTLPAARNKTKLDLIRPLSGLALAALPPKTGAFVFGGGEPLGNIYWRKLVFDKAVGLPHWTLHDLRRTARSLMSRAGVTSDIAERCLGHVIGGVRGIYDRQEYHAEKRRAFEALAVLVERIVEPRENVVGIRR